MDFKLLGKAISVKLKNKKKRFSGAAKSYVSLFLVVVLAVVSTTAWLFVRDSIKASTPTLELKSSSGMQDDQLKTKQTEVVIRNFRLEEASSVDGRNIFFPTSTFNNVNDVATPQVPVTTSSSSSDTLVNWVTWNGNTSSGVNSATTNMRFREGNAGDKNVRYAYADTTIHATGDETYVWLKNYSVKIADGNGGYDVYEGQIDIGKNSTTGAPEVQNFPDPYSCPVRIAIIDDSGHKPKVFDPAARIKENANNTNAVLSVTNDGVPTTARTDLDAFSSYYYGTNNPLFTIPAGENVNLTLVVWLEGTHPYAKDYSGRDMTVSVEVETNVNQMQEIYLHDWTVGDSHTNHSVTPSTIYEAQTWGGQHWLTGNVKILMQYKDTGSESYKSAEMTLLTADNVAQSDIDNGIVVKIGNTRVTDIESVNRSSITSVADANGCTVYKAALPKYVSTDISIYRVSRGLDINDEDSDGNVDEPFDDVRPGTIFNSWHTIKKVNNWLNTTTSEWAGDLGALSEDRIISGTSKYTHYYAIRGNGYSTVTHNDGQRFKKWLSPCIGYWGTENAPVFPS